MRPVGTGSVSALAMLSGVTATLAAQAPAVPKLIRPVWNSPTRGYDTGQLGMWVQLQKVSGAIKYDICIREPGAGLCYFRQTLAASAGMAQPDNSIRFTVSIPPDKQTTIGEWSATACNASNQCSDWAPGQRFVIVPDAPRLGSPAAGATVTNRTVTFSWTGNPLANAGYQLILFTAAPEDIGFNVYNPTAIPLPSQSIEIPIGGNTYTHTLIPGQTVIAWTMASCANFTGKGRRCSVVYPPHRTLTAPSFFAFSIAPAFKHDRCKNCHAVEADGYAADTPSNPNRGLPQGHQAVTAATNCASGACHSASLLPAGQVSVAWHAAPASMDLRNKTDAQLCQAAKQFGTAASSIASHLSEDRLILWAVGSGARPSGMTPLPTAPPNSLTTWRAAIQQWVAAGTPCA